MAATIHIGAKIQRDMERFYDCDGNKQPQLFIRKSFWPLMLMLSVFGGEVFPKEWNGIVPCVSTRVDAEKILGKDDLPHVVGIYRYKKYRIHVHYERTVKTAPNTDIVKKIDEYPDKSVLLAKYVKNIQDFPSGFKKRVMDPKITHIRYLAPLSTD